MSFKIPFAHNIEVLGPKGRAETKRISRLINNHTVTLRGFAFERDTEAANDQLAVARGLSVRKYMHEQGVEQHLKILYRLQSSDPNGRYVQVVVQ